MAAREKLIPIDDGEGFMVRGIAHPATSDPAEMARAISEALEALARQCPERHFIKHASAACASLRDGVPRGRKYSVLMVFRRYPEHYKRGDPPQEKTDDNTSS